MNAESPRARQLRAVREFVLQRNSMGKAWWNFLCTISYNTGAPEASASARLRDLRRLGYRVDKRRFSDGRYLYRVTARKAKGRR